MWRRPSVVLLALWVHDGGLWEAGEGGRRRPRRGKALACVAVCLLLSAGGVYYAFFACWFLGVAGLERDVSVHRGAWNLFALDERGRHIRSSHILKTVLFASFLIVC